MKYVGYWNKISVTRYEICFKDCVSYTSYVKKVYFFGKRNKKRTTDRTIDDKQGGFMSNMQWKGHFSGDRLSLN